MLSPLHATTFVQILYLAWFTVILAKARTFERSAHKPDMLPNVKDASGAMSSPAVEGKFIIIQWLAGLKKNSCHNAALVFTFLLLLIFC